MSESPKFTPGPWEAKPSKDGQFWTIRNSEEIVVYSSGFDFTKNKEPNARLISAAPEMYVALKALLEHLPPAADDGMCHRGICPREKCKHCGRVDAATRAIAKAEGRS